jgi:hypothetical protein
MLVCQDQKILDLYLISELTINMCVWFVSDNYMR